MHVPDEILRTALEPTVTGWRSHRGRRDAAVLAPMFAEPDGDALLFTKRRQDLRHHAGEISFPGGAREGDEDALACALRESSEEIGLHSESVDVLGRLPDRVSIAGYQVHVFVGRIAGIGGLEIDTGEVDRLLAIPLADLRDDSRWEFRDIADAQKRRWRVPFFEHDGETLWGMTARITLDLLERLG